MALQLNSLEAKHQREVEGEIHNQVAQKLSRMVESLMAEAKVTKRSFPASCFSSLTDPSRLT